VGYLDRLANVVSADGRLIFASADERFHSAFFGRDSIETLEDLLCLDPGSYLGLAERVCLSLAALQGRRFEALSEEEPGRIHHEYRALTIGGAPVDSSARARLEELSAKWGGTETEVCYYGSVDSTPLFARLVTALVGLAGPDLLEARFRDRDGRERRLGDAVRAALTWIESRIERSEIGLLEYRRAQPRGLPNQAWRDSETAYLHRDGALANHAAPIAPIEVQGYAYDALRAAGALCAEGEARRLRALANELRRRTLAEFWIAKDARLAMAVDRDEAGRPRPLGTLSSSAALLLDSGLIADVEADDEGRYRGLVERIVRDAFSEELLTAAGVRCRGRSEIDLVPYIDYHGSWAVWPKETSDISRGLRRHGLPRLARELERRTLDAVARAGELFELFYADADGRVLYDPHAPRDGPVRTTRNMPDRDQAWTISAALLADSRSESTPPPEADEWRRELTREILERIGDLDPAEPPGGAPFSLRIAPRDELARLLRARGGSVTQK
jgi:glycogen debranching enzyme